MKKLILMGLIAAGLLTACENDATIVSKNLSTEADNFSVNRRTVFYNGISGEYILSVEGLCSIRKDNADNQLELICKTAANQYKKHFLGLSDNVTYFSEQIEAANVSAYHYKVVFKPQSIVSDVDFKASTTDTPKLQ